MTMQTKKQARREAMRARLESAQRDIYGNARTPWGDDVPGFTSFYDWLGGYAEREAEYMTGDRFGMTERETSAPRWYSAASRLAEAKRRAPEQRYPGQWRAMARNNHAFPCGQFEQERAVLIRDGVGPCYSYGRNGKTFYPTAWASENGRGFSLRDIDGLNAEDTTRAIQWLEQFNAHVRSVARDAASVYTEEARESLAEKAEELRDDIRKGRATFATLAAELRTLRGINAPAACEVLRGRLSSIAANVRACAGSLQRTTETLRALRADGAA